MQAGISTLKPAVPAQRSAPASGALTTAAPRSDATALADSDALPQPPSFDAALHSARQDRRPAGPAQKNDSPPASTDDPAQNTPDNAPHAADTQPEAATRQDPSAENPPDDAQPKEKTTVDRETGAKCQSPATAEVPQVVSAALQLTATGDATEQNAGQSAEAGERTDASQAAAPPQGPPGAVTIQPAHVLAGEKPPIPSQTVDPKTGELLSTPYGSQQKSPPPHSVARQETAKPIVVTQPPQELADDERAAGNSPPETPIKATQAAVHLPENPNPLVDRLVAQGHLKPSNAQFHPSNTEPGSAAAPADSIPKPPPPSGEPSPGDLQSWALVEASSDLAPLRDAPLQSGPGQTPALALTATSVAAVPGATEKATTASPAQDSPPTQASDPLDQIVLGLRGKLDARTGKAEIRLDPPNLGVVKVSLTLADGALTAEFHSSSGLVRDLLKGNLDKLKAVLESQGVAVDRLAVNAPPAADSNPARGQAGQDQSGSFGSAAHDGRSAGQHSQDPRGRRPADVPDFDRVFRQTREAPLDLVA